MKAARFRLDEIHMFTGNTAKPRGAACISAEIIHVNMGFKKEMKITNGVSDRDIEMERVIDRAEDRNTFVWRCTQYFKRIFQLTGSDTVMDTTSTNLDLKILVDLNTE